MGYKIDKYYFTNNMLMSSYKKATSKDESDLKEYTAATSTTKEDTTTTKPYGVETLKTPLAKEEKEGFEKLSKEEQKKFVIKRWLVENQALDKKDAHEVSAEDEQLVRVP